MNTINVSTSFSPFQLRMGRSPYLIPPLVAITADKSAMNTPETDAAIALIQKIESNILEAKDNLLTAKVTQAEFTNRHHANEDVFTIGDKVMLLTEHRRCEYMQSGSDRVAKFMPRFNGPYTTTHANPNKSTYTLDLPNEPNCFPTFHASHLLRHVPNNNELFPSCQLIKPGPIVTNSGEDKWLIDRIMDKHVHGCGHQYLICWRGWGPEDDHWLPGAELAKTVALDV